MVRGQQGTSVRPGSQENTGAGPASEDEASGGSGKIGAPDETVAGNGKDRAATTCG